MSFPFTFPKAFRKGFLLLLLLPAKAFCQEQLGVLPHIELATDRPDQTEASSVIPKGTVQIEAGFLYEKDEHENVTAEAFTYPTVLARIGILEKAELRLIAEINSTRLLENDAVTRSNGLSPLLIGTKIYVCEEKGLRPEVAFIGHLALPVGSRESRPAYTAPLFRLSLAHTLSERLSLGYNVGYEWDGNSPQGTLIYTLSLAADLGKRFGAYLETFGDVPEGEAIRVLFDGGFTYKLLPNLQFDVSAGRKITNNASDYYLSTGVSIRLPR